MRNLSWGQNVREIYRTVTELQKVGNSLSRNEILQLAGEIDSKRVTHSFIPLVCAECDDSLSFSGASSIPLCYVLFVPPFSTNYFSTLSHLILLFLLGLPHNLVVPIFIYNTLLGILFPSILYTCPNQCNLFNLIVSIIVGFSNTCINFFIG